MSTERPPHPAEKLSITLPREMAQMVREKVGAGDYSSNSEVIREALRLFQTQDRLRAQQLLELKEKIDHAINTGGASLTANDVFASLRDRHQKRTRKA
ncbi:type II toxin-antitoxin system ParD family antitoxin [Nitrospira sp. M1]